MENQFVQKLPNSTTVLVLGIVSIVGCCCYGLGLIPAIIGLVLAAKDTKLFNQNPQGYSGFKNISTGKILCIIGLIISVMYLIMNIYIFAFYGYENFQNAVNEWAAEMQQNQ